MTTQLALGIRPSGPEPMWFVAWVRDMAGLYRKYRQALRSEKKAMSELRQWMRENSQ